MNDVIVVVASIKSYHKLIAVVEVVILKVSNRHIHRKNIHTYI